MAQQPTPQELLAALRKSAVVIQKQEQALAAYHEPIAVIGMGCRYPAPADMPADTPQRFWQNLLAGLDCIRQLPDQRAQDLYGYKTADLLANARTPEAAAMAAYALQGGFLQQVDGFDPTFFGLAPREVLVMDPAHRLLLETAWHALEDANLVPASLFNTEVGVFIGNGLSGYAQYCDEADGTLYKATGNTPSTAAGRLSYIFGLTGPCISLDTACSSSLVAIHLACQSLRIGECETALAGGVNILLEANSTALFAGGNMLSGTARCKTFDAAADGYVRGEGCGVVVLKRLSAAQASGDRILAVIRGTAVNQDGPSSGLTVPNGPSQERVIRRALADGNLKPDQIGYIEAHGTGTPLGDPIEIGALGVIFGRRMAPLYVGSVKTNVGHLEMAAGVAGLMKLVLALQHEQIPPHLHLQTPNPHIDWTASPVQVPTTATPWPQPAGDGVRMGGVSSFGFSGTNAHVVVAQAPQEDRKTEDREQRTEGRAYHLLTISAKTEAALRAYGQRYGAFLADQPDVNLADLCYTSYVGRTHFPHRLSVVAASVAEVQEKLAAYQAEAARADVGQGVAPTGRLTSKIAWLFTGQGSQAVNMGRDLYATNPIFRTALEQCEALYQAETGESLLAVLYPTLTMDDGRWTNEQPSSLDDTTYTQPALFAVEYALAQVWLAWGIQPDLLMGHSVGEVAAACVAGVFSLADGMKLIAARGRLMGALPQDGAMISLMTDEVRVQAAITPYRNEVSIAAVNGPESIVISGKTATVLALAEHLAGAGIKSRQLTVSHAFHSPLMDPMLADFRQVAASITYHPPKLPLVSNLTGQLAGAELTTPDYWVRHVRETVRFADGVATLHAQGVTAFLEIGPQPVLLGMAQAIFDSALPDQSPAIGHPHSTLHTPLLLPSLRPSQPDGWQMLSSLGELYVRGFPVDLAGVDKGEGRRKVALPGYPFQHQRYWGNVRPQRRDTALRPLIDKRVKLPATRETLFETAMSVAALPFLADHQVYGVVVAPGACHLALILSAAEVTYGATGYAVQDLILPQPLVLADDETRTVQLLCKPSSRNGAAPRLDFQLVSFVESDNTDDLHTTLHATGAVEVAAIAPDIKPNLSLLQARCTEAIPVPLYKATAESAMHFGPAFQWLDGFWRTPATEHGQAFDLLVRLRRPAVIEKLAGYVIHPGLLDGCFQAAGLAYQWATGATDLHLPFALATAYFTGGGNGDTWWCHLAPSGTQWKLRLFDDMGQLVAVLDGFQLRAAPQAALNITRLRTDWLHTLTWTAAPWTAADVPVQPDGWLLVGEAGDVQATLQQQLQRDGRPVLMARPDAAAIQRCVTTLAAGQRTVGVLYLGIPAPAPPDHSVPAVAHTLCSGLLHLTQALLASDLTVRLWVVTQNSQGPGAGEPGVATVGGALWGLGRTIAQEQAQWRVVCLDVDGSLAADEQAALLYAELQTNTPALDAIAYQQQTRYTAQLVPWQAVDATQPQRLQLQAYGSLDHLHFVSLQRRAPGEGELEVEVKAAGLNFRDVLNAFGMLQEYYATALGVTQASDVGLGFECAGVVTAVGPGVTGFTVGDRVMGLTGFAGAFANYLTLPAAQMVAIPAEVSAEEAATLPLAFLTAWYGLVELAHLQPGERVLIHAASGGVGQAAVQIAQAIGAEVIATASPGKWDVLRQQGVVHLLNSRTLAFADEVLALTDGRGVDVVLNSLNGAFIERSFAALGQGGRFVEIGKLGIWSQATVAAQRPDVAYYPFDLGEALAQEPTLQGRLWQAITTQIQTGALRPLPYIAFPAQEAVAAFRYMQGAKQIGKVVLRFAQPETVTIQADATYLITGGLGGLGLQVAHQLVADGARHLVLTGRRGVTSAEQQTALDQLMAAGAKVQVIAADIADRKAVQALLDQCTALAPLRGIVHAAGVLDDGILSGQTPERLAAVLRPKVDGAWHLHSLIQARPLDFFVCFSSVAALLGSPGQSNYAAANGFLDTLMQQRRQQGSPGLSINWGPWAAVGMAAHLQNRLQQQGVGLITPQQGRLFLHYLLAHAKGNLPGQVAIFPSQPQPVDTQAQPRTTMRDLLATLPAHERQARLERYVRTELAAVLRLNANTPLDPYTRLFDFGLDSLMAVELKNKLEAQLACGLRATVIFDYPTLAVLIPHLYHDILGYTEAIAVQPETLVMPEQNLEALSAEELDDLLEQELAFLEE